MSSLLDAYAEVAGQDVVSHLKQLAAPMRGMKVVHVNSTRKGGGVAEILEKLVPLSSELGLDVRWEVISGNEEFYQCTKGMHNALQGLAGPFPSPCWMLMKRPTWKMQKNCALCWKKLTLFSFMIPSPLLFWAFAPAERGAGCGAATLTPAVLTVRYGVTCVVMCQGMMQAFFPCRILLRPCHIRNISFPPVLIL